MLATISVILVIGGLIFFHELGHFLVARLFRVGVSKFSLGFGPKLFGFTRGKTSYQIAPVPLGGYVMLVGEQEDDEIPPGFTERESFANHPTWQKLLIIAAGPIFNLLLAWVIAWGILWHYGSTYITPEVGIVQSDSPAEKAGMLSGDVILKIDGQPINSWEKITPIVFSSKGRTLDFELTRKTELGPVTLNLSIAPEQRQLENMLGREYSGWVIGISPPPSVQITKVDYGFWQAAGMGLAKIWNYISAIGAFLKDVIKLDVQRDSLVGPIGIAQIIGMSAEHGLYSVLELTIFISVNLGLLNLLPIPMLDGGHIVFYSIEMITRRKLPKTFKEAALRVGLLILLALMALAVFNDVLGLVKQ